ncbi:MBL fold metallo-hydrolase [Tepidiforma sp.]|uniref:MBL fold metallo-hydrolase n=1 Tax=Tepidiforma sp. TaxID=2682230 RepID=UPI002ADD72AA|nr:MBL fold metallo-hydrolase [Tepidiforma sp.]
MTQPGLSRRPAWQERWNEVAPVPLRPYVEVLPGLYQVRTRGSKAYLVVEDQITVIDCGSPGSAERILQVVEMLGRSPDDIATIVITHAHFDHVGGLPELQRWVPARTGVHLADAPAIDSDEPLPNPFMNPLLARICEPYLLRNDPGRGRIDVRLRDGDVLPVFGGMRIVHMPGHTPGSIALYFPNRGAVIVGDAMQYKFGRLMLPSRLFTQDMALAAASIRKLAELDFETLCFSHFRPILSGAAPRVRELARTARA